MSNFKSSYERKSFTKQEWHDFVMDSSLLHSMRDILNNDSVIEPSIPNLLLNYFVVMAYEESSLLMARELGIVNSAEEENEFNSLHMIHERAHIRELIKNGEIIKAMETINDKFGVETLENIDSMCMSGCGRTLQDEDLHFKLTLLSLIEMIRVHHQDPLKCEEKSNEFILQLIEYSQEKLAMKASSNRSYMKELELVMTLLLFPMETMKDHEGNKIKIPKSLERLYSLSLRSKIAELVNRKLLQKIYPQVAMRSFQIGYPDILGNNICSKNVRRLVVLLKSQSNEAMKNDFTRDSLAGLKDFPESSLGKNFWSGNHWPSTSRMLSEQTLKNNESDMEEVPQMEYQVRLVQVMKLWAWCENQLHINDIGVPRIESSS